MNLVVVSLTVGEAFPLVVPVAKERLLALKTRNLKVLSIRTILFNKVGL